MYQKPVPDLFIILVNNPKEPLHARNSFQRYFQRGLSKSLKKVTLFFLSNPAPFNGQNYHNQKESGTRDQSLNKFKLQKKFRKIY